MMMPGREYQAQPSRFGFNGKENDNDVKGFGNQQDYGIRIYDGRLGKFLSVDPFRGSFPMLTPYQFASNCPVTFIDMDGLEAAFPHKDGAGYLVNFHNGFWNRHVQATQGFANAVTTGSKLFTDVTVGALDWFSRYGNESRQRLKNSYNHTFDVLTDTKQRERVIRSVITSMSKYINDIKIEGFSDKDAYNQGGLAYDFLALYVGYELDNLLAGGSFTDEADQILQRAGKAERRTGTVTESILKRGTAAFERTKIGGFAITSRNYLVGDEFVTDIFWFDNYEKGGNFLTFVREMETKATKSGASRLVINGLAVEEGKLFNSEIAERLGFKYEKLDDETFRLTKTIKK